MESVFSVLVSTLRQYGVAGFVTVPRKKDAKEKLLPTRFGARFWAGNWKKSRVAGLYVESVGCV
jgi:hypothetical protein